MCQILASLLLKMTAACNTSRPMAAMVAGIVTLCVFIVAGIIVAVVLTLPKNSPNSACPVAGARYCKPTSSCISPDLICNKFQDCPDNSDEINCVCDLTFQYACQNGSCIYQQWLCDGIVDCPLGDDETRPQCVTCSLNQFRCARSNQCIPIGEECNGIADCADSSDESHCLNLSTLNGSSTPLLSVIYKGVSGYYICSENWNSTWSNLACLQMGYENSSATSYQTVAFIDSQTFLVVNETGTSSNLIADLTITNCNNSHNQAVGISCNAFDCGTRTVPANSVGPYIINGQIAARGAWPWQVVVYTGVVNGNGDFVPVLLCGGILISDRWILTAGHCTQVDLTDGLGYTGTTNPINVRIILGTISLQSNPDAVTMTVKSVFTNPQYNSQVIDNDVGLMQLSQPVTFTDTIRPICLPSLDENLSRLRVCVDTGFGKTIYNSISNNLLQTRMNIIPYADCLSYSGNYTNLRNATMICIGTIPTVDENNICQGDSGGPLSCQDENGLWKVIGVNSYVLGDGGSTAVDTCLLSVVARVTEFLPWIETTMSLNAF